MAKPQLNNSGGVPYRKGYYEIKNPEKYMGNPLDCRYRSSWEHKFFIYLDHNPKVIKWGSELENYVIPYIGPDGNWHKYYPDFYCEISDDTRPTGMVQTIIEIKPESEINPKWVSYDSKTKKPKVEVPKSFKNLKAFENFEYQLETYQKNICKWEAAKKWCENRHIKFWLVSDVYLKKLKIL